MLAHPWRIGILFLRIANPVAFFLSSVAGAFPNGPAGTTRYHLVRACRPSFFQGPPADTSAAVWTIRG